MVCPNCGGVMSPEALGSVQIDVCSTCAGMWFDEGELTRALHGDQVEVFSLDLEHTPIANVPTPKLMKCPKCECTLVRYTYQYSTGVKVDSCDQCGGVYLNDGELAAIEKVDDSSNASALSALGVAQLEQGAHEARVRAYFFARNTFIRRRTTQGIVLDKDNELGEYPDS